MKSCLVLRLALVALCFLQGLLSDDIIAPADGVSGSLLAIVTVFSVIGTLFVVGVQRFNPHSAPVWRYPSWLLNPFELREPLQFFHFGGYALLAAGLGSAFHVLVLGHALSVSILFAPALGVGTLVGVYACTAVYRSKMARNQLTSAAEADNLRS